ncbi:DUF6804 family protein [Ancylobacter sp. SL191]|uniref:DUF6804 family protein n=1 Tax=Ancylobacter sp. SL191 TaxID=2995166 RepID=UPI00226D6AEB|nr:DUF6804 family protein [Ancylobacter sp. SL191]WAC26346.1 hypothetical protein OU996_15170 [Ancylobacter sp. SL191]
MIAALHLVPATMLAIALGRWPYAYYMALRLVVCMAAIILAVMIFRQAGKTGPWVAAFAITAGIFNPFIPVHLTRDLWQVLDLGAAGLFVAHFIVQRRATGP